MLYSVSVCFVVLKTACPPRKSSGNNTPYSAPVKQMMFLKTEFQDLLKNTGHSTPCSATVQPLAFWKPSVSLERAVAIILSTASATVKPLALWRPSANLERGVFTSTTQFTSTMLHIPPYPGHNPGTGSRIPSTYLCI